MRLYQRAGNVATRPHLGLPEGSFEEELGLDGFYGPVSHLYHFNPPTSWSGIRLSKFQWPKLSESPEEFLKPQCYQPLSKAETGDFFSSSRLMFWNEDIAVHLHRLNESNSVYFRNADASELYFCHEGSLVLDSVFGTIKVEKGDYVSIPKGVTYRWQTKSAYLLRIESFVDYFRKPDTGLMGQQALYHEEQIRGPEFKIGLNEEKTSLIRIQKEGRLTEVEYPYDIRNLSGWCGDLYPFALSCGDIAPAMSSVAHLPPSINSTFVTKNFIVCSFLPRPLEEPEEALKVPFFHSNIDYDEVIFYHEGDFFSRDHMEAGSISMHPRGINHGPHPKALQNQNSATRTNETAVMIDTVKALKVSALARDYEIKEYWKSWSSKK